MAIQLGIKKREHVPHESPMLAGDRTLARNNLDIYLHLAIAKF